MRPTRREIAWLLVSWLAWAFIALHIKGPWDTILEGGDHWSHFANADQFLHHGFDIYRKPGSVFCSSRATPGTSAFRAESGCRPEHLCDRPDLPGTRPLCANWQEYPQPYPPGMLLYSLPEALLYQHTHLGFRSINVISILKYLAAAHLLIWILFRMVFIHPWRDELPGGVHWDPSNPWLRWALFGLLYLEIIKWVLTGFYDPLAIFAMFVGIWFLAKREAANALVAFSASLFLHYRALWYAPLFAFAAFGLLSKREWESPRKTATKLAVAATLVGLSLYAFALVYPSLGSFPKSNPVLWSHTSRWKADEWDLLLPMGLTLVYLAWGRYWILLSTMACQLFFILHTPQIFRWHALFLFPMFGVARLDRERGPMLAALIFYLTEAVVVFNDHHSFFHALPLPGELISLLASNWGPISF